MKQLKEKNYKFFIMCSIIFIAISFGCTIDGKPKQSNKTKVTIPPNHQIKYNKSYELPPGQFQQLWFPTEKKDYFEVCVDRNDELICYEIQAPDGFKYDEILDRTDFDWEFILEKSENNTQQYRIEKIDKTKYLSIELPLHKNNYSIAVLKNKKGEELIVFGSLSEYNEIGYFGYVMIE